MPPPKPPVEKVANIVPFGLRMQPALRSKIEEAAKSSNRSVNAEIVERLEGSFDLESRAEQMAAAATKLVLIANDLRESNYRARVGTAALVRLLRQTASLIADSPALTPDQKVAQLHDLIASFSLGPTSEALDPSDDHA